MAIDASGAAQRRAEIRRLMAIAAGDRHVFACERVGCSAVVEIGNYRRSRDTPARRLVALLAGARETAIVGIAMATGTLVEGKTCKANRRVSLLSCVTSLAQHTFMQTRKRETGLCMIKMSHRFPCSLCVTTLALSAKLPTVFILMAGRAIRSHPKKTLSRVALSTSERHMLPFEDIPGLPVVELGNIARPANQTEVAACVFGVTPGTVALAPTTVDNACVISPIAIQPLFYFHMARQTLQLRASGTECVAVPALESPLQVLVSLR